MGNWLKGVTTFYTLLSSVYWDNDCEYVAVFSLKWFANSRHSSNIEEEQLLPRWSATTVKCLLRTYVYVNTCWIIKASFVVTECILL